MESIVLFAAAEAGAENASLFQALGLDAKQLLINGVAFLILVGILGKFVFPTLVRSIDERRDKIEASLAEAKKSQEASEQAGRNIAGLMAEARKEADEVAARSHKEAAAIIAEAEDKARQRAEQIVSDARSQLEADVAKARTALKRDTLQLVVAATERVIDEKLDAKRDATLIETAIAKGRS